MEREIEGIWRDVLALPEPLPSDANFFALGGNSLAATRILLRVNKSFGVRLALGDFLAEPSICALAARLASILRPELAVNIHTNAEKEEFTL